MYHGMRSLATPYGSVEPPISRGGADVYTIRTMSREHPIARALSNFYVRLALVGIILVGGALYIGQLDQGEINVAQTIEEARATGNDGMSADNVASIPESFRNMPNGGLVPQDPNAVPPTPQPEPEPATTTEGSTTGEGSGE